MKQSESNDNIEKVIDLTDRFESEEIQYVVLTNNQNLSKSSSLSPVEILIANDSFAEAIHIAENTLDANYSKSSQIKDRIWAGITQPKELFHHIINPDKFMSQISYLMYDSHSDLIENKGGPSSIQFDGQKSDKTLVQIHKHIEYKNPFMKSYQVRTHPDYESHILETREFDGQMYKANNPSELCHIIARCVFNKQGEFSASEMSRCEILSDIILKDDKLKSEFEKLLNYLFWGADTVVYESVKCGSYRTILQDLKSFSDY